MSARRFRSPAWILTIALLAIVPILVLGLVSTWKMQDVLVERRESATTSAAYAGRLARTLVETELHDQFQPVKESLFYAHLRGEEEFETELRNIWITNSLLEWPQVVSETRLRTWAPAVDSLLHVSHLEAAHGVGQSGGSSGAMAATSVLRAELALQAAVRFGYQPDTGLFDRPDLFGVDDEKELESTYRWIEVGTRMAGDKVCKTCSHELSKVGYRTDEGEFQILTISFLLPGSEGTQTAMFGAIIPAWTLLKRVVYEAADRWQQVQSSSDAPELPGQDVPLELAMRLIDVNDTIIAADERTIEWHALFSLPLLGPESPWLIDVLASPKAGLGDLQAESTRWTVFFVAAAAILILGAIWMSRQFLVQVEDSKLRSHLLSNISHELKTPLSLIRLYTDTLESGRVKTEAEGKKFLGIISRESKRLSHLIENILNIQRIEQDRKTYSYAQVRPDKVVRATVDAYRFQLTERGFELKLDVDDDLPLVMIDEEAIAQALVNLLDNAAKYSTTVKDINVRCFQRDGRICIAVRDRGVGIPRSEHEKIFDSFYRVEKELVHDVKGSGLGLAVVAHVAKAHGGTIELDSVPGKGSTFSLCIPVEFEPEGS